MLTATDHPAVESARAAIVRVREAGAGYSLAIAGEAALLQEKPIRKQQAIARLMGTENPLIPGKAYTCTSAEAVIETDPAYLTFAQQITEATCERELARTGLIAARLEAQLALALLLADGEEEDE
jgi:hypothetical protein